MDLMKIIVEDKKIWKKLDAEMKLTQLNSFAKFEAK